MNLFLHFVSKFWEHGTSVHEFSPSLTLTYFCNNWPHAKQAKVWNLFIRLMK
jgi:hypothetical protein